MDASIRFTRRIVPATSTAFLVPPPAAFPLSGAFVDLWFSQGLYYDNAIIPDATSVLTCARASIGYAKTQAGGLTQFANNTLRITDLGLLAEDTATNLVVQSQTFGTTWTVSDVSVLEDQTSAPDGTVTMDKITDNASDARHIITQSCTIAANTTYTLSVFAKNLDRRYVEMEWVAGSGDFIYCVVDLQTGTITDSGVGQSGSGTTFTSATIESFANGTYRIKLTGVCNDSGTLGYAMISLSNRSTFSGARQNQSPQYIGDGSSVYLWGAQLEAASLASSYIPTTTTSETRAAEIDAPIASSALDTLLDTAATDGSVPVSVYMDVMHSQYVPGLDAILGDSNNPGCFLLLASDIAVQVSIGGGAPAALLGSGAFSTGAKVAMSMDASGKSVVGNNGAVGTDNTPPAWGAAVWSIGRRDVTRYPPNFLCRRLTVWDTRLSDATLKNLTII